MVPVFRDAPLILPADLDAASLVKLTIYYLDDLDHAIITTTLGVFSKVQIFFSKLFPLAAVVH